MNVLNSLLTVSSIVALACGCASTRPMPSSQASSPGAGTEASPPGFNALERTSEGPMTIRNEYDCPDEEQRFLSALETNTLTLGLSWPVSQTDGERRLGRPRITTTYRCRPR